MLPQYAERDRGGEIAIWLLITVGALLIPIIIIAVCCIRRHWARRPCIKLMENQPAPMTMSTKHVEAIRSYNGPYTEAENDDVGIVSGNNITPTFSRSNSLKKQHVHWPDGSKIENFHSTTAHQQSFSGGNILNTTMLTESPSSHRRSNGLPITSSALSHFIQTAIIPAGSTVGNTGASQLLTPSKDLTSISAGYNSIV